MNKTAKIIYTILAAALILGLTVGIIIADDKRKSLERQLTAEYDKSMQQLTTELDSLITKLEKLEAASSANQRNILLMDVWRQTGNIQNSLSEMPVSYANTSTLTQFINRTGDYCYTLCQTIADGEDISEDDIEQIKRLAASCGDIQTCLLGSPAEFALSSSSFTSAEDTNLDFTSQQYARLQYDGPFSESTENKQPKGLGDKQTDEASAKQAAAGFLTLDADDLKPTEELSGRIESFGFTGEAENGPFTIYITKTGAKVLWYMCERNGGISAVPTNAKYNELTRIAKEWLNEKGYGETQASYAQFYDGLAIINLAPVENDVVLYPDLIKVWVDISKLRVVGMDANNYLMSHTDRELEEPLLTKAEAQNNISKNMVVENTRLALIPLDNGAEALCYEFTGQVGSHDYIIYINVQSGKEEDILMIKHTGEGTLVM